MLAQIEEAAADAIVDELPICMSSDREQLRQQRAAGDDSGNHVDHSGRLSLSLRDHVKQEYCTPGQQQQQQAGMAAAARDASAMMPAFPETCSAGAVRFPTCVLKTRGRRSGAR